jgi:predicted DsbA family dithiol-disulfide isomerase/uncharacterized membrane protein
MFAALLLVLAHFDTIELPGCGTASDCTRAAASRWGKLPGTEWPLSFVGFAYFQAIAATFLYGGGRSPKLLRVIVGIGAAISVLLTVAMFVEGYLCGYCLTIHVLNIAFALGYEASRWYSSQPTTAHDNCHHSLAVFAATFLATSLLLAVVDQRLMRTAEETRAEQLERALSQARAGTFAGSDKFEFGPGRYYLGLKTAPVHVVVVSDYQCPSCRTVDAQLRAAVAGREDISVSARHFPFCTDCNPHIDKTRHPNSCRAALAAEAAGTVGGTDAFWKMHDWLFEHHGEFNDDQLHQFVREIGLDEQAFLAAMRDEKTTASIRADADAADAAALQFTPMVFINGKPIAVGG